MRARHLVPVLAVALLSAAAGCGGPAATRARRGPSGAYIGTRALEPAATEDNRFHGADITTWTTRLRVREVLWRRPGAPEPTPTVTGPTT